MIYFTLRGMKASYAFKLHASDSRSDRPMKNETTPGGTVHDLPSDLRQAIESEPTAAALWLDITPLARNEWICWVTSGKRAETRKRRIEVGIDKMRTGMRRPCCWPGCPHR
ncbi:YdeI/OmpD-associated family protein [Arenimonas donghaensis]|uniref:YdeI/OmpD-associated family protein n=1 Tax=Arenimonas donghaensis TaxID=375061 RepID=UPI001B808FDC